jgi:tryptophan synthase alpha chain
VSSVNRIDKSFADLKHQNKKALITFITAGDPDMETTENLVLEMEQAGADVIELGVPFSDPVAEGPVIQEASERALKRGTTLKEIFALVKKLRQKTDIPILLMMYLNCIFKYGKEKFFANCVESGIDGVIVPDMPFEERDEIFDEAKKAGVYSINLVAPTSRERIKEIACESEGFLYCVSSLGVTGQRNNFSTNFDDFFTDIKKYSKVPYALGFGISTPQQVSELAHYCDGLIVGSAIVKIVCQYGRQSIEPVSAFVKTLKDAMIF